MGCSFPVAEIKFFIYIKNAGLEKKKKNKKEYITLAQIRPAG